MDTTHILLWRGRGTVAGNAPFPGVLTKSAKSAAMPATPAAIEFAKIPIADARKLSNDPGVAAIAPVMPMRLIRPLALEPAADPLAGGVTCGIRAVGAHSTSATGSGIVVAVLDTGIDAEHPAFRGMELVRRNFTSGGDADEEGHGTHCAGTIFGRDVDGTRIGVARGVTRALIGKVLGADGGGSDAVVNAIQWAARNGAHVISMSLGLDFRAYVAGLTSEGIPAAQAASMALEGYRANVRLFESLAALLEANSFFTEQPTLLVAAADGVVSVAALQRGHTAAGARLSAPGAGVISARRGGGLVAMSGSSMATPHVAGVAALWAERLAERGELTAIGLLNAVTESATRGHGIVQAPQ